jgi:hypothetical protein
VARARVDTCPVCRRSLPDFGGWPAWCPDCGWGLTSAEPAGAWPSRFARWWRARTLAAEQKELRRLLADPALLGRPHPRRTAIFAAAAAVHLVTLLLLATGAWIMTTGIVVVVKIGAGIVLFGLVAITFPMYRLRPRIGRRPADTPATLAVAATVTQSLGLPPAKRVHVASLQRPVRAESPRLLTIDVDRWHTVDAPGRIALLAHASAHRAGHDPRRTLLVITAAETLNGWLALLRPDPRTVARRRSRVRGVERPTAARPHPYAGIRLAELILPLAIAPIYAAVLAMGWVLREGGAVAGMRAELHADALAAQAGGAAGIDALIDGELAELSAGGNMPAPLADVPAIERERRRRVAIAAGTRLNDLHPTYADRLAMLAVPQATPVDRRVNVSAADLEAVTRELDAQISA